MEAGRVYSLVESTAMFEAYRYNLAVLQGLDTKNVPLARYIVHVTKDIEPLKLVTENRTVNLKSIMVGGRSTATKVRPFHSFVSIPLLHWANCDGITLNETDDTYSPDLVGSGEVALAVKKIDDFG